MDGVLVPGDAGTGGTDARRGEQGPTAGVLAAPRDPCTGLLPASVPREGWGPADALRGPGRRRL
ncbi:hypothetical protein [Streptomyces sp. NPDC088746]|uniref:hypothetical protein n=1 Tax=Streptomyces sp. NPDC088746 TaxID=3365885 RepID=UPI0038189C74